MRPVATIVVPTRDRPALLATAVDSALAQDVDVAVIVVDDGSTDPVALPRHPRLQVLRHDTSQGGSVARNLGAREADTSWVMWLDDDDELLPHAVSTSLEAIDHSDLPGPVAAISGIEVIDGSGRRIERRLPPSTLPRGSHFWLEGPIPGRSYNTKQTLLVDRQLILDLDGFDPAFRSRVHSELFLRLNPVCSLVGVTEVTYRLRAHPGPRVSGDPVLRQQSFAQLVARHRQLFDAHPEAFAAFLLEHARSSWTTGQRAAAGRAVARAARVAPAETAHRATGALSDLVDRRRRSEHP